MKTCNRLFLGAVKHRPDREILGELIVAVRRVRRRKHHVARPDHGFPAVPAVARGARRNDVEFVARMRNLWAGGGPRGETDPEIAMRST